ncbi:MAG: anhydro-N-acetylmuramic acid kinase [Luminiphilus sp.]
MNGGLFIGLMSGTSADGIDAVLVRRDGGRGSLLASHHCPMPLELRREILAFRQAGDNELHRLAILDSQLADAYAKAISELLREAGVGAEEVTAIGQHGQTLRHHPEGSPAYTVQIGDPNRLAELSGITVVADFRRRDMAAGGQGAPLVPAFHAAQLATPDVTCAIVNIGGIANVTVVEADGTVTGWDTGPGNTLLDAWVARHQNTPFDAHGAWSAAGKLIAPLLERLLAEPYFGLPHPKSTGPEYFHLDWLATFLDATEAPVDVQRTLVELTIESIARALTNTPAKIIRVCGGGANNDFMLRRLTERLPDCEVTTTAAVGIDPAWVEAWAFAWLAEQTLQGRPGNVPGVTGARGFRVLGGIYPA